MSEPFVPPEIRNDSMFVSQFDQIQTMVSEEFDIEESLLAYGVPTFYVKMKPDSKKAFTRLVKSLRKNGFTPLLRRKDGRNVLKIARKPKAGRSRPIINVVLLLVTVATVFVTGYLLSLGLVEDAPEYGFNPWVQAAGFTLALLGILGVHEMAHKLAANHHKMMATLPYFIPGPPFLGIGTFGAVIVQKETAPNRDALFDIGASGPIAGFAVAILVTAIGLWLSPIVGFDQPLPNTIEPLPVMMWMMNVFVRQPAIPPSGAYHYILLHPVAFAGWIGIFVTLLNLLPTGMLDGGHTLKSIINNDLVRSVFTVVSVLVLLLFGQYVMLALVLFLSMYKHPGPLDDVSSLSPSRKLVAVSLLAIFAVCLGAGVPA